MKYIIEFKDDTVEYTFPDGMHKYYHCISIPLLSLPQEDIDKLTPFNQEEIENKVWNFVRFMSQGMDSSTRKECFEFDATLSAVKEMPYQEAKAKYEAWKQEKEEIHVGDEVKHHGDNCVVVYVGADEVYHVSDRHWSRCVVQGRRFLTKTGRHFEEVESLLKRMREQE